MDLNLVSRPLRQQLAQHRAVCKIDRHQNRPRHIRVAQINLFQQGTEERRRAEVASRLTHARLARTRPLFLNSFFAQRLVAHLLESGELDDQQRREAGFLRGPGRPAGQRLDHPARGPGQREFREQRLAQ